MLFYKENDYKKVIEGLEANYLDTHSIYLASLSGIFGTGKSTFIKELFKGYLDNTEDYNFISYIQDYSQVFNVFDLLSEIFVNSNASHLLENENIFTDSKFYKNKADRLFTRLQEEDSERFEKIDLSIRLKSKSEAKLIQNELTEDLLAFFEKDNDKKLFQDCLQICAESLILDLITYLYDFSGLNNLHNIHIKNTPKKVCLIFEDYRPVAFSLQEWIKDYLLKTLHTFTFKDLKNYDIQIDGNEIRLNEFLDIRIILAGREVFENSDYLDFHQVYPGKILDIRFDSFSKAFIKKLLEEENISSDDYFDDLFFLSKGNPLILSLLIESMKLGASSYDMLRMYQVVENSIFRHYNEHERDWVRCAVFLDDITPQALRCFPLIKSRYAEVFAFLSCSPDLLDTFNSKQDKLYIKHIIKDFIVASLQGESPKVYSEFNRIAEKWFEIKETIQKFNDDDLELIRNLAYFKAFDEKFALEKAFGDDFHKIRKIIDLYSKMFVKYKYTTQLKKEVKEHLDTFNKLVDLDKYDDKLKLISPIWESFRNDLLNRNISYEQEINCIAKEMEGIEDCKEKLSTQLNKKKAELLQFELKTNAIKQELAPYSPKKTDQRSLILLILSIVLLFAIIIINVLYDLSEGALSYFSHLLNIAFITTFLLSFKFLLRKYQTNTKKIEIERLNYDLNKLIEQSQNLDAEIKVINADILANNDKIKEQRSDIERINVLISENKIKAEDKFCE